MKKVSLFILFILCLTFNSTAYTNYFRPGTTWITKGRNDYNEPYTEVYFIDRYVEVDGEMVLPFYSCIGSFEEYKRYWYKNKSLLFYLKTEEDKVYWKKVSSDSNEWYLMYDFSVGENDTIIVDWARWGRDPLGIQVAMVTCIGIEKRDDSQDWLKVESFANLKGGWPGHVDYRKVREVGYWIVGLGNPKNPLSNIIYDNPVPVVVKIMSFGRVVYESPFNKSRSKSDKKKNNKSRSKSDKKKKDNSMRKKNKRGLTIVNEEGKLKFERLEPEK